MLGSSKIRVAVAEDALLIAHQRRCMFADHKPYPEAELTRMENAYAEWVQPKLATGEYWGWLAENEEGVVIAGVGLWLREYPPILFNPTGKQGYVENVYTHPDYRRQGIARQLMQTMLAWLRTSQVVYEVQLHPTPIAHPLYAELGFQPDTHAMIQWFG